jgi:hypothetical protein
MTLSLVLLLIAILALSCLFSASIFKEQDLQALDAFLGEPTKPVQGPRPTSMEFICCMSRNHAIALNFQN